MSARVSTAETEYDRMREVYLELAANNYRPFAPSDGFGNITIPLEECDLEAEADEFARHFTKSANDCRFFIGCPNFAENKAMAFLIEAARMCCSGDTEFALRLAEIAADELRVAREDPRWKPKRFRPPEEPK